MCKKVSMNFVVESIWTDCELSPEHYHVGLGTEEVGAHLRVRYFNII